MAPRQTREAWTEAADLMRRYCEGDVKSFHQLYALLAPRVLGYLAGLAGERAAAEDLLQLTFLKLHEARGAYVRGANPIPWVFTIAHRTCLDELRRRRRSRVRLVDRAPAAEPRATLTGSAEAASGDGDAAVELGDLDALPRNQKEALLLTKVHGHSIAEAAQITGSTPGAVKLRVHRAYVTLRERRAHRAATRRTS